MNKALHLFFILSTVLAYTIAGYFVFDRALRPEPLCAVFARDDLPIPSKDGDLCFVVKTDSRLCMAYHGNWLCSEELR